MERLSIEKISSLITKGLERAAQSFSVLMRQPVQIKSSNLAIVTRPDDFSLFDEEGELTVLVTNVIGGISGKSFLIFNAHERREILNHLPDKLGSAYHEAFLLEIDNIISASVIAAFSEALQIEAYGDVPQLRQMPASELKAFIHEETQNYAAGKMVSCSSYFTFSAGHEVHPQFIWKIRSDVLQTASGGVV